MYIIWTEKNNVGIPIVDEQHRGIISSINSLYYFIRSGQAGEIIRPTMIILQQYVKVHFRTEEMLLQETHYSEIDKHVSLHHRFISELGIISKKLEIDEDSDIVLKFLKDWWLGHINVEDRKYAPHVKKTLGMDD